MITIKNLDPITEAPETYGYISLGTFKSNPDDLVKPGIYKGECESSGKSFDLYLFQIGYTGNYTILGDLTCIPGNTLVDNQEIIEALEKKLEAEEMLRLSKYYLKMEHDIYNPLPSTTINGVSTGTQGTTTISSQTKNFIFKVNYDSRP